SPALNADHGAHQLRELVSATSASQLTFLQLNGRATSGGDLLLCRRAERVRRNLELHLAELACAEHLHRLALADRTGVDQLDRADLAATREEFGEPVQVHHLELDLELVLKALELRQAHV